MLFNERQFLKCVLAEIHHLGLFALLLLLCALVDADAHAAVSVALGGMTPWWTEPIWGWTEQLHWSCLPYLPTTWFCSPACRCVFGGNHYRVPRLQCVLSRRGTAAVDALGKWQLDWEPLAISADPERLNLRSRKAAVCLGRRVVQDVLVGEVWLCSGQSNMEWVVGRIAHYPGVEGGESQLCRPAQPQIRIFSDPDLPVWEQRGWQGPAVHTCALFRRPLIFSDKLCRRIWLFRSG